MVSTTGTEVRRLGGGSRRSPRDPSRCAHSLQSPPSSPTGPASRAHACTQAFTPQPHPGPPVNPATARASGDPLRPEPPTGKVTMPRHPADSAALTSGSVRPLLLLTHRYEPGHRHTPDPRPGPTCPADPTPANDSTSPPLRRPSATRLLGGTPSPYGAAKHSPSRGLASSQPSALRPRPPIRRSALPPARSHLPHSPHHSPRRSRAPTPHPTPPRGTSSPATPPRPPRPTPQTGTRPTPGHRPSPPTKARAASPPQPPLPPSPSGPATTPQSPGGEPFPDPAPTTAFDTHWTTYCGGLGTNGR